MNRKERNSKRFRLFIFDNADNVHSNFSQCRTRRRSLTVKIDVEEKLIAKLVRQMVREENKVFIEFVLNKLSRKRSPLRPII